MIGRDGHPDPLGLERTWGMVKQEDDGGYLVDTLVGSHGHEQWLDGQLEPDAFVARANGGPR